MSAAPRTEFEFDAPLWEWPSRKNWWFVTVPDDESDEIAALPLPPAGFGSVKVRARVGKTVFDTSVFPGENGYVLPIKAAVRRAEGIEPESRVHVSLEIVR